MKKKLLIENEIEDLTDFQKILLLNKKKIDSDDVEFNTKRGDDVESHVEWDDYGLQFNFRDLEEFLKFFFPETYEEGSDGEWDARSYDRMFYGDYDFANECYERSYDDWKEGYTFGYLCEASLVKLKTIIDMIDPKLARESFREKEGKIQIYQGEDKIVQLLDNYFKDIQDEIDEIICPARHRATSDATSEYLRETFCDGLNHFGIKNWTPDRWKECFKTYFIPWSALVQMFVETSEFDGNALDVMFDHIEKNFRNHPPQYYEMEYNFFDNEVFEKESCEKLTILFDEYIDKLKDDFSPEYKEAMGKISGLNLFDKKQIPETKNTWIKVDKIDPETLQVSYRVGEGSWFSNVKYGKSTVDEVITMATQPGLFNPTEYRVSPN